MLCFRHILFGFGDGGQACQGKVCNKGCSESLPRGNYLSKGLWVTDAEEELTTPGLSVKFRNFLSIKSRIIYKSPLITRHFLQIN